MYKRQVVKTIEKAWLEVELPLERETEGVEKIPSLMGKSDARECNESALSNCRGQLALSSRPSLLIKRAALGNLKASFHCTQDVYKRQHLMYM